MGCGESCVKYLLFGFNFLFTIAGIGMLVVGILLKLRLSSVSHYMDGKFSAPPILLIVVGSIVFIIAFYGCCGAIRDSSCMLTTYSVFLMVLLLAGIAVSVVAFVFKDKVGDIMTTEFEKAVDNYHNNTIDATAVDTVQQGLGCCGANGTQDYSSPFPKSCCRSESQCTLTDETLMYKTGCLEEMKSFINHLGVLIGSFAIGVSAIMIVGIVFGLCLASSIRRKERGDMY